MFILGCEWLEDSTQGALCAGDAKAFTSGTLLKRIEHYFLF